jgi:hypothetical protein
VALQAGSTFLLASSGDGALHLHIVVFDADANGNTLIVNLTTLRDHPDTTVVFNAGDHPFLKHASIVYYAEAQITKMNHLEATIKLGVAKMRDPLDARLLDLVRKGFATSLHAPKYIQKYCADRIK